MTELLMLLAAGVCPQRAGHSYFLGGAQLPLEARMTGIFAGFLATVSCVAVAGGGRLARRPDRRECALLIAIVGVMAVDGLNATAYDLGLGSFYQPANALRLASGLLAGMATALLFLPVCNAWTWQRETTGRLLGGPVEVVALLALGSLILLAAISGRAIAFYPLALLGVGGLVALVAMLNLLLLLALRRSRERFASVAALAPYGALAVALAVGELLALAALRYTFWGRYLS